MVEEHSSSDNEDLSKETAKLNATFNASVTVCYSIAMMPVCKKVEFTVEHKSLQHQNKAEVSLVITQPNGFPFSSQVLVYPAKQTPANHLLQKVITPSLNEVCSQQLQKYVPQCRVPVVRFVAKPEMNHVELQIGRNDSLPSMCVQYEKNGNCQGWNKTIIPQYSVTLCMCFQVWDEDILGRSLHLCPFHKTDFLNISQRNMRDNVTVSLHLRRIKDFSQILLWNVSAPCRLEGEVWLCHSHSSCMRFNVPKQQLVNGTWKQDHKGFWVRTGEFENIDEDLLSPCLMIRVKAAEHDFGPFCITHPDRGHWALLVVGGLLLICVIAIMFYIFHDLVKKWAWSWHRGGLVKICRKGHVVLLSPPDPDDGVSESICQLGSSLLSLGFSVAVDQWSRKQQCMMGPLPWLYAQLLKMDSVGGKVVLILNHRALERCEGWTTLSTNFELEEKAKELPHMRSPYADTFTASMILIQAEKQLDGARGRFLLVKFRSHQEQAHSSDMGLPELLQGLPLFHLPSQTRCFINELTMVKPRRESRRKWTRKKRKTYTARAKEIKKTVNPI
ncbi:uncharacterized protein LOC114463260 isoform X2 [Gouania willdenowi]|nr:uncharacterized protein LOC114463260 isoform X2 [Gouania willdenowi]